MLTLTVSQLNEYLKSCIDSFPAFQNICVKGEISNFTNHYKSGHFYFSIKDKDSVIRAVMFKTYADYVPFEPQNGMKITARGRLSVFPRDGIYQLYCEELIPDGIGEMYLAYEQLKEKLEIKGYFDESIKKTVPPYPERIGVITSPTGAAVMDIRNILSRRYPICNVELFPALVQGAGASESLIDGIKHFDGNVDTIIIGRGGGSIEDLWAFNNEKLAEAIYRCKTPVISAVGHETDFTICDFVADLRAPTPSAAAELAVPDIEELKDIIKMYSFSFSSLLKSKLDISKSRVDSYMDKKVFSSPYNCIDDKLSFVCDYSSRISKGIEKIYCDRDQKLHESKEHIQDIAKRILPVKEREIGHIAKRLEALSPLAILSRGYAAVFDVDGKVVSSVDDVNTGDNVTLALGDGRISAKVYRKKRGSITSTGGKNAN